MYYILIYNTGNTPATPLYDAHLEGSFYFINLIILINWNKNLHKVNWNIIQFLRLKKKNPYFVKF